VPADDDVNAGGPNALVPPGGTEGIVTDIEFDEVDPLTVRYERDQVLVTIKAQFKPAGQALVPPMSVTIPYQIQITGNKIRLIGERRAWSLKTESIPTHRRRSSRQQFKRLSRPI